MGFLLKKFVGAWLMPLPMALVLGTVGWLALRSARRVSSTERRGGRVLRAGELAVGLALLILWAGSCGPLAKAALRPLERAYPAFPGDSVGAVVVLASGFSHDLAAPPTAWLSSASLYRVAEGVRIARAQPWATLLLPASDPAYTLDGRDIYRDVAIALGMDSTRIAVAPWARDTAHEAEIWSSYVGDRPFALVTSASHMARAAALFRGRGLAPIAAPTGHLAARGPEPMRLRDWVPGEDALVISRTVMYEWLGHIWVRLRGQV